MYRAASQLRSLRAVASAIGLDVFTARLRAAVESGDLRDDVALGPLAELLMRTVNETSLAWALDEIDAEELEARCQHALAVILAAVATTASVDELQRRLVAATERVERARPPTCTK